MASNGSKPEALIICGDGINCEYETEYGFELAGFSAKRIHCSDLLANPECLKDAQALIFPGGFSFGDEIASGKVLAIKLREKLQNLLHEFIDRGHLVIGICNGFQILVQLGILPNSDRDAERTVSLCHNSSGRFINRWVSMDVKNEPNSQFFKGLETIHLPMRHGEGRLAMAGDVEEETKAMIKQRAPLRYQTDVNGSFEQIAALTNAKGNVLGLMPHPEAFVHWNQHPAWAQLRYNDVDSSDSSGMRFVLQKSDTKSTPHGLKILQNAAAMVN